MFLEIFLTGIVSMAILVCAAYGCSIYQTRTGLKEPEYIQIIGGTGLIISAIMILLGIFGMIWTMI